MIYRIVRRVLNIYLFVVLAVVYLMWKLFWARTNEERNLLDEKVVREACEVQKEKTEF